MELLTASQHLSTSHGPVLCDQPPSETPTLPGPLPDDIPVCTHGVLLGERMELVFHSGDSEVVGPSAFHPSELCSVPFLCYVLQDFF